MAFLHSCLKKYAMAGVVASLRAVQLEERSQVAALCVSRRENGVGVVDCAVSPWFPVPGWGSITNGFSSMIKGKAEPDGDEIPSSSAWEMAEAIRRGCKGLLSDFTPMVDNFPGMGYYPVDSIAKNIEEGTEVTANFPTTADPHGQVRGIVWGHPEYVEGTNRLASVKVAVRDGQGKQTIKLISDTESLVVVEGKRGKLLMDFLKCNALMMTDVFLDFWYRVLLIGTRPLLVAI